MPTSSNSSPHFQTYYSSHTEDLITSLLFQLENDETSPINTPFGRAHILVPNSGMQRYLELKIAERFGICSHIDISYIGQLVTKTYKKLLDDESPAHVNERLLTFALLRLWDKRILPIDNHFKSLYQQHNQSRQRYLFANKIAKLLRQYMNERPEMIDAWQAGKLITDNAHEVWQRDVLQQLLTSLDITHTSRLDLQQRFVDALTGNADHELTNIIHVFGFHAIPASQLTDLLALGQATQVIFYTFNPCIEYWLDIVPEKLKTKLEITHADEAELITVGHPLLASWGQSGKFLIEQLNDHYAPNLDEIIPQVAPKSLLSWLQNDIRELSDSRVNVAEWFTQEIERKSPSFSLHACANPRREIEVLYDNLCQRFENSDLNPADVLVIVPKLGDYAPHIQAIFSRTSPTQNTIPYSLANQSSAETEPDVQAFLSLLEVLNGDFQAQLLFEALSEARIQEALNLSQSHLDSLRHWFSESRFSLHFYDDSEGESSSLEKLLDSLLLAAVGGEGAELGNRQASSLYHGGQAELLTQLCELWQRFVPFVRLKKQTLALSAWRDKLRELSAHFLPPRHAMGEWLNDWFDVVEALGDKTTYDFATIHTDLSAMLQNDTLHGPFLSGGVSFCAVVPMRSIPAKMIAVLGLDNDFPSISAKDPLDLRLVKPLWSDRNPHKEQQYFFLETLMAAREQLYLSHVGLNEKTGEYIPPSALVRELFGYIERHIPHFSETVTTAYPLQGFVSESSYQTLYTTPGARPQTTEDQCETINLPDTLTANELTAILLEPLTAFWRYNLGATLIDKINEPLTEHEFVANEDGLDKWQYENSALEQSLNSMTIETVKQLKQDNLYAPQTISDALLSSASDAVEPLIEVLSQYDLTAPKIINETIKIPFADQSLYLRVKAESHHNIGLLSWHTGKLDAKKMLRAWIVHLIYHALPESPLAPSLLLTIDKGEAISTIFVPIEERKEAWDALNKLLILAHHLIQQPYPVKLSLSGKRAETVMHYEAKDYPLYSAIADVDDAFLANLAEKWLGSDNLLLTSIG